MNNKYIEDTKFCEERRVGVSGKGWGKSEDMQNGMPGNFKELMFFC